MSTIKISLFLFLISISAFAQNNDNDDQMRTLFGNGQRSIGGYGGITARYTEIGSAPGAVVGFRGCMVAGHTVAVGIGGNGLFSNFRYDNRLGKDALMAGGYGGLYIEPIVLPKQAIHIALPVLIGAGGIAYSLNNHNENWHNTNYTEDNVIDSEAFFIIEPGVELEFNVVKYFRIGIGAYYRFTTDVNLKYNDNTLIEKPDFLRGFSTGVTLKFGLF